MRVSVCMIVWNEEGLLPRAIASTRELADEVIVLDTGSTDGTIDVARSLGAIVLVGGDRMHKGESRNRAMGAATGDWIVILDADETIADPAGLRAHMEQTDVDALYIRLAYMAGARATLSYAQMRIWRRGTYQYRYRAHEVPVPVGGWGKVEHTAFAWEHRPPADRAWKSDYTLERLRLDVEENPGDRRPLFYLGRLHANRGQWEEGRDALRQYLDRPGHDQGDGWYYLASCYGGLGDREGQIRALYQACATMPERREFWGALASLYHAAGQDHIALGLLRCAKEQPRPAHSYVRAEWYGATLYDLMARCLWKLGRYEEGQTYAELALSYSPDDARLKRNLLWFRSQNGDMDAFYTLHGAGIHSGGPRHAAIAELVEGPRVLDVGCGTGDLLALLTRCSYVLHGTDKSAVAIEMARERVPQAELWQMDTLPDGQYNTIVMSQVLEHLDDEKEHAFIAQAREHLAPNGLLIVTVPRNGAVPSPDHKREYTEESLRALLGAIGDPVLHSWSGETRRLLMTVRA